MFDLVTALWVLAAIAGLFLLTRLVMACQVVNLTDWGHAVLNLLDGFNRLFCQRYHRMSPTDIGLPEQGPAIVVANHVSGLDPMLLIAAARRPLRFMIAKEQYERFGLQWLFRVIGCIPVDREGRPDQALRAAVLALQQGEVVALFPHGKIHLDTDRPRRLKGGAARLAKRANCDVYPVRLDGIAGQGHVVRAVFKRSQARVQVCRVLRSGGFDEQELTEQMRLAIEDQSAAK
ncbi:MAG: lysophospholipid acyltransferase family protein [Chromatiales bacterium]|jgi:1-acyl-sn-glycerol-3-phosphate acyltransferase